MRKLLACLLILSILVPPVLQAYRLELESQKRKEKWREPQEKREQPPLKRSKVFSKREKELRERDLDYNQEARNSKYRDYGKDLKEPRRGEPL